MAWGMDVTKPYEFIGFGAMDVTKPYEFIGFGATVMTAREAPKPQRRASKALAPGLRPPAPAARTRAWTSSAAARRRFKSPTPCYAIT